MVKIIDQNYEKISDTCLWLSGEFVLKFNVELYKKSKQGQRYNFHKEIGYTVDDQLRININRDFISYLSIESIKRDGAGNKVQIRIDQNNIYFLRYRLHEVANWFISKEYESLFIKKDRKIYITQTVEPIKIQVMFGNYIEFEPAVITYPGMIEEQTNGVNVYLNNDGVCFFMSVNTLLNFMYFIDTFNMYQSAQLMLNYIGRPDNGTNISFTNNSFLSSQPRNIQNQNNNIGFLSKNAKKREEN